MSAPEAPPDVGIRRIAPDALVAEFSGSWRKRDPVPSLDDVYKSLAKESGVRSLTFETGRLGPWDSRFVAFVARLRARCAEGGIELRDEGLPDGVRGLLRLAAAVPEARDAHRSQARESLFAALGNRAIGAAAEALTLFSFLGELVLALGRLARGKAQFRSSDLWQVIQETGPEALGIVALINFLIGLILAFVGATSLAQFGASIYVADMVAIGTTREMACIMTAIILCGRTGAAFAAHLGTMKVNEEIAALQTFGIAPMEFLVLPRVLALVAMTPLLVLFADLISIAGGWFVSVSMLDVTTTEYLGRTIHAVKIKSFLLGVFKGGFFGFLVAYTGCLRGMRCGNNAAAVGRATTQAVVAGITSIIAADGIFAILCNALKI
ncbi:MAG: ABC transporter permease [Verrucomicrobiales bacterium]|nr:ABC transporter permease [Verrucomicrobiales bacterium]